MRRAKREHWRDSRRGRHGGRGADPGQRFEAMRRELRQLQQRLHNSPCRSCPYFGEHRAHRAETRDIEETLEGGEAELEWARHRYRREFGALRGVLHDAGFLEDDAPNDLGLLAASLFGENALLIADAIVAGHLDPLTPAELAAALVTLVAEDRGRDRPQPSRRHFPTPRVELALPAPARLAAAPRRAGARAGAADAAPALARLHQRRPPVGVGHAAGRHRDARRPTTSATSSRR